MSKMVLCLVLYVVQGLSHQSGDGMTITYREVGGQGERVVAEKGRLLRRGTIGVRGDGSRVEKSEIFDPSGKLVSSFREIDLSDGTKIKVDDITRVVVAVRSPGFARDLARRAGAELKCLPVVDAAAAVTTNCVDSSRVSLFKNREGKVTSWTVRTVESVAAGRPADQLFSVPDSYERVTFVERYMRESARFGMQPFAAEIAALERVDEQTKAIRYLGSLR